MLLSFRVLLAPVSRTENRFRNEKVANTGGHRIAVDSSMTAVTSLHGRLMGLYRLQIAAREASAQAVPLAASLTFDTVEPAPKGEPTDGRHAILTAQNPLDFRDAPMK